jgi:CheY-like chemotaxis protein
MQKIEGSGPVLIVDDDFDARDLAEQVFSASKIKNKLVLLDSGSALIEYLERVLTGMEDMPSLVLLDVNMPPPDGHQTLREIRSRAEFQDFPKIIVFTVSNDPEDMKRALGLGANGYETKPFSIKAFTNFANSLAGGSAV